MTIISKECLAKNLITNEVCQSILNSSQPSRAKAKDLITHVWGTIREDDNKCEQFLQILAGYRSCRETVAQIRRDQQQEEKAVVAQERLPFRGTLVVLPPATSHLTKRRPCSPVECSQGHTQATPTSSRQRLGLWFNSDAESKEAYYAKQEIAQREAHLLQAQKENEKLKAERSKLQDERDTIKKQRSALQKQLHLKDREMEKVTMERENLKDSNEILRQRVSRMEKKSYADRETIKRVMAECEEKLAELESEREDLIEEFEASDKRYQNLQQRLEQMEGVAENYKSIIERLQAGLTYLQVDNPQQYQCCTCRRIYKCQPSECNLFIITVSCLLFLLLVSIAIAYYILTIYSPLDR